MNSGDCCWNVWARACLRGGIRETSGAGTGAMGTPFTGTKSTCVLRHCVPSPQGKVVTQRYLFYSFICSSLPLCIVNRDPYHFRLPSRHPSSYCQHWNSLFLPGKPIVWPWQSCPYAFHAESETCCRRVCLGKKHLQEATAVVWAVLLMLCLGLQHSRASHYTSGCTETWY